MDDRQQGRFITVTLDMRTGTHTLHNWPTLSHAKCIAICQSMPPSEPNAPRMLLKAHDNDPKDMT